MVAKQANISPVYKRNLCIDQFKHNTDGTIDTMKNTVDGVAQLAFLNPFERVEAETMNAQSGIYTESCKAGGMDVCNIENGDWIKIRGVDFGKKGAQRFMASVAGTIGNGQIELRVGDPSGKLIGTCKVASTGNEQSWKTISCKVNKVTGVQDLYLKFTGGEGKLFNFDWWQFREK